MSGSIDQIHAVSIAVVCFVMQANTFRFDGDAALAFQIHRVEHLLGHLARRKRAGEFEQTIGKRGLAVINVGDDAEISYELAGP